MSVAHMLRPAPAEGAQQLFLLFPDAGQSWQSMNQVSDALGQVFPAAAVVVLQGPHALAEGGCWLMQRDVAQAGSAGREEGGTDRSRRREVGGRQPAGSEAHDGGVPGTGAGDERRVALAMPTADDAALAAAVAAALPGCIGSIRVWQAQMKVLPEATALIGVGEGATMALAAATGSAGDGHPVCGRVSVLGGRFVLPEGEVQPTLLLHLLHGKADPLVHFRHTLTAAEALVKQGGDVVADIVPHERGPLSEELVSWLMNRLLNRVPRHIWQAAMRMTDDEAQNACASAGEDA